MIKTESNRSGNKPASQYPPDSNTSPSIKSKTPQLLFLGIGVSYEGFEFRLWNFQILHFFCVRIMVVKVGIDSIIHENCAIGNI